MGNPTILDRLRWLIGNIALAVYFWAYRITKSRAEEAEAALDEANAALAGLMKFHPEDELGPTTEEYWSPEYKAAIKAARAALGGAG